MRSIAILAAAAAFFGTCASAAPQLSVLPELSLCMTGSLAGFVPPELDNLIGECQEGESCEPVLSPELEPILKILLGSGMSELPVDVGVCTTVSQ
ncbi:hypothetical protein ACEPAF_1972 [Sanghuangporus sanghuang]